VDEWLPVFALPNLALDKAIETTVAALVPSHDTRVKGLREKHSSFNQFLRRFSDSFGVRFEPALILLKADAPKMFFDIGALSSFRNLIALSAIMKNRALEIRHPHRHGAVFGEAFAFYPWMLDRHYEHLIGQTPALLGMHQVCKLKAQSSPALSRPRVTVSSLDAPILQDLLRRWEYHYGAEKPDWHDVKIFRSLNMAYHASLMPAVSDTTFLDIGRLICLWVSALEILVHPGGTEKVNRKDVINHIDQAHWERSVLNERRYTVRGESVAKRTLAAWLCDRLYECRNDFLHGNPVDRNSIRLPNTKRSIFQYAAPLYRIALAETLKLWIDKPDPSLADPEACGEFISARLSFLGPQRVIEDALLTAVVNSEPPEDTVSP
jgi:hypothetical protein